MSWKRVRLEAVCTKITDGTHKTPKYVENGVCFLSAKNINNGYLNVTNCKFITTEEHKDLKKRCFPEAGDVMLSKSGSLGEAVIVPDLDFEFSVFESLALLKVDRRKVVPEFLQQLLSSPQSKKYFHSITTGLAVKHLHLVDLRKMRLILPPVQEQTAIADLLSTWDAAIEKIEKLIAAKGKRYSWLLSRLISDKRHPRGHIRDFAKEVSIRNRDGAISQVLSVTNHSGFVLPEDQFERRVASSDLSNYKIVTRGQYAYNPSRVNVGSIARLNDWDEGVLSPMYVVFELDENKIESDFFHHWLQSHEAKQRIKKSAQGSVRETVSFGDFSAIPFPLPPEEQQQEIAGILNTAQQEIALLKNLADACRLQKRGLMQKLLTGQWRVTVN